MGLSEEVELLGARVYGSRSREGLYHEGSDIDVVVSYSGNLKEDAFFSALHEDGLKIAGIPVDINPISTEKTGTLEEYLENAEKYLDEKQGYMEITESNGRADRKQSITFYVEKCYIDGKEEKWLAFDSIMIEGRQFFLMEHETYGKEVVVVKPFCNICG